MSEETVNVPPIDEAILRDAFRQVFRQKGTLEADILKDKRVAALVNAYADTFTKAIRPTLESGVIPSVMAEHLRNDVFVFSGFKTYQELKEASALLMDENGQTKSFDRFYKDISAIKEDYNRHWLKAEYIFAQASAEMAARWKEFEEDGDRYNLQYRTANDNRVRFEHRPLHGITLPLYDPFWDEFFPPNGWRCRCTVVQVRKGKYPESDSATAIQQGREATHQAGKNGVNKAAIFRYNPGKQQVIFPPHHPYYEVNEREREAVRNALAPHTQTNDLSRRRKEIRQEVSRLKERPLQNVSFGKDIALTGKSIKEWLNQPHVHYAEKNELLPQIWDTVRTAAYKGAITDLHNPEVIVHLFEIEIADSKSWIIVKEFPDGQINLYSVTDSDKMVKMIK